MPSLTEVIVWIVVGLIAGTLAGSLVTRQRAGFGLWRNLGVGLAGALVGGFVFRAFGWLADLAPVAISLRDVIAALVGSLVVLGALWLWRRTRSAT